MTHVPYPSSVVVSTTMLGADNVTRVRCPGPSVWVRCDADVFDDAGTLTITSQDEPWKKEPVKEYLAGEWLDATVYDTHGYVLYHRTPTTPRPGRSAA